MNKPLIANADLPEPGLLPHSLTGFRNLHAEETIIVCGCGASLTTLPEPERFITIGVNDVGRLFQPTYLVVLNPRQQFQNDRFRYVENSQAQAVFTQLDLGIRHPHIVRFRLGKRSGVDFSDPEVLHYTRNSPYVALCLAVHMGAKRIGLIGVDFTDDHFFARTGRHPLTSSLAQIEREYARLGEACRDRGIEVINLSRQSRLTAFPKLDPEHFAAPARTLHIVSYATTPVAGVPAILARCIAARSPHRSRCVWANNDYGNGVVFTGDVQWQDDPSTADALLSTADLVIVHNGKVDPRHRSLLAGKPVITMAHNYLWNVDTGFVKQGLPGCVVGQYQATLTEFKDWSVIPNPLPFWEPAYCPEPKPDVVTICYTPSGKHERYPEDHRLYWHGKGYRTTLSVLERLAKRYRLQLEIIRDRQISHAESLAMKRRAHIVIDECVTGSYHRNSLEGLAAGCVIVNGVGLRAGVDKVFALCAEDEHQPFVRADLASLESVLIELIESGPQALATRGQRNREWLEQHWDFARQWQRFWQPLAVEAQQCTRPASKPVIASAKTEVAPVSVVIPHGGHERLSLLEATLQNLRRCNGIGEIIVVEMDENPLAAEIAERLADQYTFVHNQGQFHKARTMNAGIALAGQELLLWLDNDLLLLTDFIDKAVAELQARQLDCLVPWTSVRYLSAADSEAIKQGTRTVDDCKPMQVYYSRRGACGAAVLVRMDFLRRYGGLCEEFRGWGGEDNAWFYKARLLGQAAISRRDDQHIYHLYHPRSGGNPGQEHIAANPHYARNVALLNEMRSLKTPTAFLQRFPPSTVQLPQVLVAAAGGIGDILRITPLIRALFRMDYRVDVLVMPDYPEVVELLEGAPEIRRLFYQASAWSRARCERLDGLAEARYQIATFTTLSSELQARVQAERTLAFERTEWEQHGDSFCCARIAESLGWQGPLPAPFAMASDRQFGLPPGTIALHPGCKPNWPWKKWHGFAELAARLPAVAIIGTEADLDNERCYFRHRFEWPTQAHNNVGKLGLRDTAALLRECTALVANDSGLMHLGAAVGIPTFGIFGPTDPRREAMPTANLVPISGADACTPTCRRAPFGQRGRTCKQQCLRTLSAAMVLDRVQNTLHAAVPAKPQEVSAMNKLSLVYYGYLFDASGYGQAARAYIHALHEAGIALSAVDLTQRPHQVHDPLVESLLERPLTPDFHLFHGIPPQWARLAFRHNNAIGMAVWETDTLPSQWRNTLEHTLEVWLPCEHNTSVFAAALSTPVFRLPHPLPPAVDPDPPAVLQSLGKTDFVFYSLFEWQHRKGPGELLTAYLQAFPNADDNLLIIKSNPAAAEAARTALAGARQSSGSQARVEICCEAWNEAQISALHQRGDCYVSLHHGEGWGYPLFEAASRGTPTIATGYSGPLDYLNDEQALLVRYQPEPVRQAYQYYHPGMRWAAPDVAHAAERMRWVYEHRETAREQARNRAQRIQQEYSPVAVGAAAKMRLLSLLKRTRPQRWRELVRAEQELRPSLPIPGEWYDEDYFENGLKSNWEQGYSWPLFHGVFTETAAFLTELLPEAGSFLDIGCAKGFLIRALREAGKECWGFDHSPWAVAHADEQAKPYLIQAGVDDADFDRQFDVLLSFETFEQLTEEQIDRFLKHARRWTRQAILATIPTVEAEPAPGGDLAHVTMRSRAWWHQRFLDAGWRQDPLHRYVQRLCQDHALPRKMGWDLYLYVP